MGALLERLHHEHVERRRKWFPLKPPGSSTRGHAPRGVGDGADAPRTATPEVTPPAAQAGPPSQDQVLLELELYRLVKRAEKIELMLAGRAPLEEEPRPLRKPPCRLVQRIVAQFYRIAMGDMISHRRTAEFVRPRQIAMYLVAKFTRRSLPEIGRRFDHRDHTTVLHALRKIDRLRKSDPRMRDELQLLIMRICEATGCAPFEETPGDG